MTNEGEPVRGAPHFLRAMPKSKKDYDGELNNAVLFHSKNGYISLKNTYGTWKSPQDKVEEGL